MDNWNYPLGSDTPNAPWNIPPDPEERAFEVTICQSLSKTDEVHTNDYIERRDYDEEGCYEYIDTSDTNWNEAVKKNMNTIPELLKELKDITDTLLENWDLFKDNLNKSKRDIEDINRDCQGWELDESEVIYE